VQFDAFITGENYTWTLTQQFVEIFSRFSLQIMYKDGTDQGMFLA